jgi:hypothetical protein
VAQKLRRPTPVGRNQQINVQCGELARRSAAIETLHRRSSCSTTLQTIHELQGGTRVGR